MSEFETKGICLEKYHGNAETVIIPESVRVIGECAFRECDSIRTLLVPGELYEIGRHAFLHCQNLASVTLPDKMFAIAEDAFFGCTSLEYFTVPEGVWSLGSRTFKNCYHLKTLTVPDSVSMMACLSNINSDTTICAHKGSVAETLMKQSSAPFRPLAGTVKEGFYPEVSYNGTVTFYHPSKGICRQIIEGGFFLRDQSPGYELPGKKQTPYFERTYIPQCILRRMIFSRTGGGYRVDMTIFPRNDDVRKELGFDRLDFYASLNDEGCFISKFKPLLNGTRHCLDENLEAYEEYLKAQTQ